MKQFQLIGIVSIPELSGIMMFLLMNHHVYRVVNVQLVCPCNAMMEVNMEGNVTYDRY